MGNAVVEWLRSEGLNVGTYEEDTYARSYQEEYDRWIKLGRPPLPPTLDEYLPTTEGVPQVEATSPQMTMFWSTLLQYIDSISVSDGRGDDYYRKRLHVAINRAFGLTLTRLEELAARPTVGIEQLAGDDPRLGQVWTKAYEAAVANGMCENFDRFSALMRGPRRPAYRVAPLERVIG